MLKKSFDVISYACIERLGVQERKIEREPEM
jgi:hypothetical protein